MKDVDDLEVAVLPRPDVAGALRLAVALDEGDAERVVVLEEFGGRRSRAAHRDPRPLEAEASLERVEHAPVGEPVGQPRREADPAGPGGARVPPPDGHRQPAGGGPGPRGG